MDELFEALGRLPETLRTISQRLSRNAGRHLMLVAILCG
jgi:hypothetical protein